MLRDRLLRVGARPLRARAYNVLFICTGNSARSIIAEALLNHVGHGRFRAFSAGSDPRGTVHPETLALLRRNGIDVTGLRSKSWDEFAGSKAPQMDFVFTVCDKAAGEQCPVWLGHPVTAHWGFADPAAVAGEDDRRRAFERVYEEIGTRLRLFTALPIETLERTALQHRVTEMGKR